MFCVGEEVRVISEESTAIRLQEELGGWDDNMRKVNDICMTR